MEHTKIIAVANQKGGVGKTAIATWLAYLLAEDSRAEGGRTVERHSYSSTVVDFDSQCNATMTVIIRDPDQALNLPESDTTAALFGWSQDADGNILWDMDLPLPEEILAPPVFDAFYEGKIRCVPGHPKALAETDGMPLEYVVSEDDGMDVVQRIRQFALASPSDFLIIDCPPQLGVRQISAMLAADYIVAPVNCDLYSDQGLHSFVEVFVDIRSSNPSCELIVLANRIDARAENAMAELDALREQVGDFMVEAYIPSSTSYVRASKQFRPPWRKTTSGNDAAFGRKLRDALAAVVARIGVDAR